MFHTFLLIGLTACGPKDTAKSTSAAGEATQTSTQEANTPNDKTSKKFSKNLMSRTYSDFTPGSEGLVYKSIKFSPDNTWTAEAAIVTFDEEMECVEKGTWTLDPAESETVASMTWKITETDCPTRESGADIRLKLNVSGTQLDAEFR